MLKSPRIEELQSTNDLKVEVETKVEVEVEVDDYRRDTTRNLCEN